MPTPPTVIVHASDHWSDRAGAPIRAIVLHHTAGTNSLSYLTHNERQVSAHALITKAGVIYAMTPDSRAANAVGFSTLGLYAAGTPNNPNRITYNIELENSGDGADPYPDAQIDAAGWDCARVWRTHGVVPILTHALIDTRGKTDPRGLDLARVFRATLAWYDAGASPPEPPPPEPLPPGAAYTPDSPIVGPARATIEQCLAVLARRLPAGYTAYDQRVIVAGYHSQAAVVGLDATLAVAQMIHETGALTSFWSQRPQRNPAGIGVTGDWRMPGAAQPTPAAEWRRNPQRSLRWERGLSFASWLEDAIPAHLGRLLAYARTDDQATAAQRALIVQALAVRPLPAELRGSAHTLAQLGTRWAASSDYGARIADVANAIRQATV